MSKLIYRRCKESESENYVDERGSCLENTLRRSLREK